MLCQLQNLPYGYFLLLDLLTLLPSPLRTQLLNKLLRNIFTSGNVDMHRPHSGPHTKFHQRPGLVWNRHIPLGSVQNQPTGKIKSREKYLFSRHPKHTIGICSLRYIQIQGDQKHEQFLQKLKNPKSSKKKIFFGRTSERRAVS